jgi:hypothetical protein
MMPDAVRIVLLPAAKVCHGPKRLQQRGRGIFHNDVNSCAREAADAKKPKRVSLWLFA